MTEAIFGLLGVLVGGLLNGGVAWLGEHRRLRGEAKVSARLVASELERNTVLVESALKRASLIQLELGSRAAWEKNRGILASALTDQEWSALDNFYLLFELLVGRAKEGERTEVDDDLEGSLKSLLKKGEWALAALRRYAGAEVTIRVHADSLKVE